MVGLFRKTEEVQEIKGMPFDVYEWVHGRDAQRQPIRVRFVAREGQSPRMFYIEPVLRQWFYNEESDFLDKACEVGARVLGSLERHTQSRKQVHRLFAALFRNRDKGHGAIARQFNTNLDLYDASTSSLITPGLNSEWINRLSSESVRNKATRLL